ncbi:MAG: RibD family protein [Proteobacteria bacterium]|nr:RibD family protein [Pseudomonadota bacterium]
MGSCPRSPADPEFRDDEDAATAASPIYGPIARGPFVLGQLGQSLDGRIATPTGHSRTISGAAGIAHLHRLRAMADAVVVGIGTILADDPQMTVRAVPGRHPARVVIDPRGRMPCDARVLADNGAPCFVVQTAAQPRPAGVMVLTLPADPSGGVDPHALVAALAARGFRRLLIEGGGQTVSRFLACGALTRLHVCVTPVLIGSGPTGLCLPPITRMEEALRPRCRTHLLGDDVLFDISFDRPQG